MWEEISEIVIWMVLAALLGLLVGWALATAVGNRRRRAMRVRSDERNREFAVSREVMDPQQHGQPDAWAEGTATAGLASATSENPQLAFDEIDHEDAPAVPDQPAFFDVPEVRGSHASSHAVFDEDDDLEAIHGVGPKLATLLRANGVRTFRAIAAWSEAEIEAFSEHLPDFPDRIREEGWVESAREQHERKYGL